MREKDGGNLDAGEGEPLDASAPVMDAGAPEQDAGLPAPEDAGVASPPEVNDAGTWSDGYPSPLPAPPQALSEGGRVLSAPRFVPVFFGNDDPTIVAKLSDFMSKLGSSTYWAQTTQEYGVGAATSAPAVQLAESASGTIDDSAIQTWLSDKLRNDRVFPAPDENTVYIMFYPAGTTITIADSSGTAQSCVDFGGYHGEAPVPDVANGRVVYAVIPRCPRFLSITGLDVLTSAASHELIEASTDPDTLGNLAYEKVDDAHAYWGMALGAELGDLCAQFPGVFTPFPDLPYTVQRSWSNDSIRTGHDPCVPALPGEIYFNTVPELNDDLILDGIGTTAKGLLLRPGESKTINLDLYSDGLTNGPWTVDVKTIDAYFGSPNPPNLDFTMAQVPGQNGDRLQVTIKKRETSAPGQDIFVIVSQHDAATHLWFGLAGE